MRRERWLPIAGFEGLYSISDRGRVRSEPRRTEFVRSGRRVTRAIKGGILKPIIASRGYHGVHLCVPGNPDRIYLVHILVAAAFIGPRPPGAQVAHWNGNQRDSSIENLRYASRAENEADKVRHGRTIRGSRNPVAKLSEADILQIRALMRSGLTARVVAPRFGVTRRCVNKIASGERWAWLEAPAEARPCV